MNLQSNQQTGCFNVCNIHHQRASSQRLPRLTSHIDEDGLATEDQRKMKKEMDELLAKALSGLTLKELQQHQEVLHGVDERIAEEVSFIDDKLEKLDLQLMSIKEGSMYEVAEQMDAAYVHDRSFRIMFLRANEYDPNAAADQTIRFFESKNKLFGQSKLTKDITMEDLDEDDIALLESGWLQLAGRDQSGRQIFAHFGSDGKADSPKGLMSVIRTQFFVFMRALQSKETQIRGIVSIWYMLGKCKNTNQRGYNELVAAASCIPQRKAAIHVCVDDMYQYALLSLCVKAMRKTSRARFRVHIGSHTECQYRLTTFGILSSTLPIDDHGNLDLTRHLTWLRSCAVEDNEPYGPSVASRALKSTTKTNQNDVLFQNQRTNQHAGNKRFRAMVKHYTRAYDQGSDAEKRDLVATVTGKVYASGGRFLKQSEDSTETWEEVPYEELRKKIMQMFRNQRRPGASSKPSSNRPSGVLITGDPHANDVIFGRAQRNPGSELLTRLIKEHAKQYDSLNRGEKIQMVESIMQTIRDQGGRFLITDAESGESMEISHDNARERISKSFRNLRRQSSRRTK